MSCYRPIKAYRTPTGVVFQELKRYDIIGDIEIPCGMCVGCRMRRAADWTLRCMHEASMHERNCFVTLTYGRDKLPPNGSLCHEDFQKFLKRVRKSIAPDRVRFYMCGEYGPLNSRPHYHACLFGVDWRESWVPSGKSGSGAVYYDSQVISELWGHGRISVQDMNKQTAGYCARYIMKKQLGKGSEKAHDAIDEETGEVIKRIPEYAAMSLKPGIGANWIEKYTPDVYRRDSVVADGALHRPPRYYDKIMKRRKMLGLDELEYQRELKARKNAPDSTPERRAVREKVAEARISNQKRTME